MLRPCYLNQKQEEMFHRYCNSCATSLHDVYESWSDKKEEAYKYCLCDMKEHDGVASYCVAFNYSLEEEDFHCKRLKACKNAEVKE